MPRSNLSPVLFVGAIVALMALAGLGLSPTDDTDAGDREASVAFVDYSGSIFVNVTDDAGRPVPDANVTIDGNETTWEVNETGVVIISDLLADSNGTEYEVSAKCVGYEELAAVSVEVTPSNTSYVNLTVGGGTISGIVEDANGRLAGANVLLEPLSINTTTDGDGRYAFDGLKGNISYTLTASAPNHENQTESELLPIGDIIYLDFTLEIVTSPDYSGSIFANVTDNVGRPVPEAEVKIDGEDGSWEVNETGVVIISDLLTYPGGIEYEVSAVCVGYEELAAVSVTVTPSNTSYVNLTVGGGTISGIVEDANGRLAGANVLLEPLSINTTTDGEGRYSFNGLEGNKSYTLTASAPYHDNKTGFAPLPIGGIFYLDFDLASKTGSISGMVLHETTDAPLAGANVSVRVEGDTPVTVTVPSDMDGSYYMPNVPAGTYSVTAALDGFNTSTVTGVVVESGVTTENVDIHLEEKPTVLSGTVRSGSILLVGANVSLTGTDLFGLTSIDGKYEIRGVLPGTYTVDASLEGYNNVTVVGVEIALGALVGLDFNLTGQPGGLYGIVVDSATGEVLPGVRVMLLPLRETITNINGEFEFPGLKEGNYTLRFILDGYRPFEMDSMVLSHEEKTDLGEIRLDKTRDSYGGFIFGFDLAHSMMILALFLTIVILALAVVLRIRTFESPDKAPAIYDELDEKEAEEEETPKRKVRERKTGADESSEPDDYDDYE